jgi:hypothetical protein
MTKHYNGKIVEGRFEDRIYLEGEELSIQASIHEDFKNKEVHVEIWLTTEERPYMELESTTFIDFMSMNWLRMYTQFRTIVTKRTMMDFFGQTEYINNKIGNYLYIIVTEIE